MRVEVRAFIEDNKKIHPNKGWGGPGGMMGHTRNEKSTPDTGEQVTCSGTDLLNMSVADLIPTSRCVVAVNKKTLTVMAGC